MKLEDAINRRHSVREFSSKKVKWDDLLEAIDSAAQSPFAGNINNLKFIIVSDKEKIQEITKHTQQFWMIDAPYFVIVCADHTKLESLYDARGITYSHQQIGAAIQNFLLRITDLGLASCWVGAYSDELIKQLLKIPEHINLEAILPVGYEKGQTKKIKKTKLENLINWETWGTFKKPINWPYNDPSTK